MTAETLPSGVAIHPIPAFTDNYIWCIYNESSAIVVDPGDAEPVLAFIKAKGLTLSAVLITHHHRDHTGGIAKLILPRLTGRNLAMPARLKGLKPLMIT